MLGKWESIDDEIWAKVIVLERNRRVAKAYARAPVLTINGSDEGFDGFRYVYFLKSIHIMGGKGVKAKCCWVLSTYF